MCPSLIASIAIPVSQSPFFAPPIKTWSGFDFVSNPASFTASKNSFFVSGSASITYEIADVIETLEAVKRTRFNELVGDDFMIVEHKGKEYILSYGPTDLFTESLIARDENGNVLTGKLNEDVEDDPKLCNDDPYGKGWIAKVSHSNLDADLNKLMKIGPDFETWMKKEIEEKKALTNK